MRPGRFNRLATQCLRPILKAQKTFLNTPGAIFRFPELCHHCRVKMRTISHSPSGQPAAPAVRLAPAKGFLSRRLVSPWRSDSGIPAKADLSRRNPVCGMKADGPWTLDFLSAVALAKADGPQLTASSHFRKRMTINPLTASSRIFPLWWSDGLNQPKMNQIQPNPTKSNHGHGMRKHKHLSLWSPANSGLKPQPVARQSYI